MQATAVIFGLDFRDDGGLTKQIDVPDQGYPGGPLHLAELMVPLLEKVYPELVWQARGNPEAEYKRSDYKEKQDGNEAN